MITQMSDGVVEFRLFCRDADRVELLGSFTGWEREPIAMEKNADGWFIVRTSIQPGEHEFQYRVNGTKWLADFAASGVRMNDFGLWVSQLYVPEPRVTKLVVETRPVRTHSTPAPGGRVRMPAA